MKYYGHEVLHERCRNRLADTRWREFSTSFRARSWTMNFAVFAAWDPENALRGAGCVGSRSSKNRSKSNRTQTSALALGFVQVGVRAIRPSMTSLYRCATSRFSAGKKGSGRLRFFDPKMDALSHESPFGDGCVARRIGCYDIRPTINPIV